MNEFINELILSKGKNCLIFVVTDSVRDLIERMGSNDIEINEIRITSSENPLETLVRWKDSDENTVFAVHGMKSAFPEILGYLNLHRDLFYDIKRPVVIMGSDYEITEIARYAPDFWRFRRSTYDFTERKEKGLFTPSLPEPRYFLPSITTEDDDTIKERMRIDEHLLRVVKEDYKKAELYMSLAISYCKLQNFFKGKEYLEKSIEIKRKLNDRIGISINYVNFGGLHLHRKNFNEAIRYYDKALKLNPDLADTYLARGLAYVVKEVYGKALEDFSRAIELNPDFAEAYFGNGLAYYKLNQYEKAIKSYTKAIELNPDFAAAYIYRGIVYNRSNQYGKAIKDFNSALESDPNNIAMMALLSENYILNNEYKNARKTAEQILNIAEGDNDKILSHFFIICSLLLQKEIEDAKQEIDKLMAFLRETEHWKITFNFQNIVRSIADSDTDVETRATLTLLIDLLENTINLNQFSSPYANN